MMLETERQIAVVKDIKENFGVTVSSLAQKFAVSTNTIRRDLEKLVKQGTIKRIHGGALLVENGGNDLPFEQRKIELKEEKEAIGAAAAALVSDGDTIIIDAGTTCLMVAKHLKEHKNLTILTNSIAVSSELANNSANVVYLCGGMLRGETLSLIGTHAEEFFGSIHVNKLFLAVGGVSLENGILTNPNIQEVPVKKKMMKAASEIIVVADSYKFGQLALCPFADIRDVHKIVTDTRVLESYRYKIEELGPKVILASLG